MEKTELDHIKLISKWEEKRNLFEWKICDVCIWEYIRLAVLPIILNKVNNEKINIFFRCIADNKTASVGKRLKEIPFKKLTHKDVLIVNSPERVNLDGILVSRYIDKMVEYLDYSYYVLENQNMENSGGNIFTKNIIFYDYNNLSCTWKKNSSIESKCKKLFELIEHDFNIKFEISDKNYVVNFVYSVIQNQKVFKNYYKLLLKQITPKVIIVLKAVQQHNKYLIEVAKEMGIPTVEYEHSLVMAESFENYYEGKRDLRTYPDYKWLWGECVKESYRLPIENERLRVVGNGYYEWRVKREIQLLKKNEKEKKKKNILIISDFFKTGLEKLALEISELLPQESYEVIFKLHPGEPNWKSKYPELVSTNVKVRGNERNNDIYKYLARADYVIGSASTALSEAVEFGADIFIYSKSKMAIYSKYLIEAECATEISDVKDFISKMEEKQICRKSLYKQNPIQNINREIKNCINDKKN